MMTVEDGVVVMALTRCYKENLFNNELKKNHSLKNDIVRDCGPSQLRFIPMSLRGEFRNRTTQFTFFSVVN